MDITVKVPSHVEKYLKNYAATLFYDTSEYALSRAILVALISKLDEMCLISPEEVVAGVMKGVEVKGVTIKETTIYGALDTQVDRNWLTMNEKREFSLTEASKKWVLKRQNQEYLIEKGFLDPIEGPVVKYGLTTYRIYANLKER